MFPSTQTWWHDDLVDDENDPKEPAHTLALFTAEKPNGPHLLNKGTHRFTLRDGRTFYYLRVALHPGVQRLRLRVRPGGGPAWSRRRASRPGGYERRHDAWVAAGLGAGACAGCQSGGGGIVAA